VKTSRWLATATAGLVVAGLALTVPRALPRGAIALPVPRKAVAAPHDAEPSTVRLMGWHSAVGVVHFLDVYHRPWWRYPSYRVSTRNPWGQSLHFLVTRSRLQHGTWWLRLMLGVQPNGSTGWVRADQLRLTRDRDRIVVDRSTRTLRQFHDGRLEHRFRIAIGAPGTPTTTGLFFVWAKIPSSPDGPYGAYVLGLSGFSPVLHDWPGGGRLAIHGTPDPADAGAQVSHGCVRVYNPLMEQLRDVPMGTPVVITN